MNDEKTAVINMVSEGILTPSEGISLLEALYDLEDMGSYESDVDVDDPKYLPPWESESGEINDLLGQNKCSRAITCANQQIISSLWEEKPDDIPSSISALDLTQLSRFEPSAGQGRNGGFTIGYLRIKRGDDVLFTNGWSFWMHSSLSTEAELPPTWAQPMMIQIFMSLRSLRLKGEMGDLPDDEEKRDQIKVTSKIESLNDSVMTEAGQFHECLKLKTDISSISGGEFDPKSHGMIDEMRRLGTHFIWLAPNVGIVKFVYEHSNNTQTEIELIDYEIRDGEPLYFPLTLGNKWLYQWQDEIAIHREQVRVFSREGDRKGDGAFALSCAKHIEPRPEAG